MGVAIGWRITLECKILASTAETQFYVPKMML